MRKLLICAAMLLSGGVAAFFGTPEAGRILPFCPAVASAQIAIGSLDGIEACLPNDGTDYSVFYARLDAYPQRAYAYRSHSMRAASMIKVFILGKAMQQIQAGAMHLEDRIVMTEDDKVGGAGIITGYEAGTAFTVYDLLVLMITESDNTATNMMIDQLGMDQINQYIAREGYADSILQRKMMDFDAVAAGRENYTSVNDLGTFFVRLYNGQVVDPYYDGLMIEILKGQTDTEGIPTALPNAVVAHKTGELGGVYNDGGIVYDEHNSVIVVMTDDFSSRDNAIDATIRVSRYLSYEFGG